MKEDINTAEKDISILNVRVEGIEKDVKELKENESKGI